MKKDLSHNSSYSVSRNQFIEFVENKEDIKQRSVRGGTITLFSQIVKTGLQLVSMVVLARLLIPQDFGLIAMVGVFFSFLGIFQDLGLSTATIQQERINHDQVSMLFWVNILFSLGLVILSVGVSPIIAWFYGEPKLSNIAIILSISFLFGALGIQHRALLMRHMLFGRVAFIEVLAVVTGFLTAIALVQFKYWALVAMSIVSSITTGIGFWLICDWRPSLPKKNSGIYSMLTFGSNLTGVSLINYFSRNLDNILIGRVWGATQLGFYSRAYNLFMIPMSQIVWPIASVATPALSRLRGDESLFRKYYLNALSVLAFLTVPLGIFLIIMAEDIILIILGSQWRDSIPIFRFLSLSILIQPIYSSSNWLFIVTGRGKEFIIYSSIGSALMVLSFFIGLPYGPSMVALCYSISVVLWTFPNLLFSTRHTPVNVKDVVKAVIPAFAGGILAGAVAFGFKLWAKLFLSNALSLLVSFLAMVLIYILCVFWLFDRKDFYFSVLRSFLSSERNKTV